MNKNKYNLLLCSAASIALVLCAEGAWAQSSDIPQLQSKEKNCEDNILKDQIKYSNFTLLTAGEINATYNDNIYHVSSGKTGDLITSAKPEAIIKSNWKKHSIRLNTNAELGHYMSKNSNDYTDFNTKLSGRYDTSDLTGVDVLARYQYNHNDIGSSLDEPESTLKDPVIFEVASLGLSFNGAIDKTYSYDVGVTSDWYDYRNTKRRDGTTSIYDDKDHRETWVTAKLARRITPASTIFAKIGQLMLNYDKQIDTTATIGHNSKGYLALVGMQGYAQGIDWSIAAGYRGQNYDNASLPDITTLGASIYANFALDKISSVSALLDRDIKDSISTGVSGYVETKAKLAYDRRLNQNWSGQVAAEYRFNDFKSNFSLSGINRDDKIFEPSTTLTYDINDQAKLDLKYAHQDRNSNQAGIDYKANIISVGFKAKY